MPKRELSEAELKNLATVQQLGCEFRDFVASLGNSRETSAAKTKIDEAVMWACSHITGLPNLHSKSQLR